MYCQRSKSSPITGGILREKTVYVYEQRNIKMILKPVMVASTDVGKSYKAMYIFNSFLLKHVVVFYINMLLFFVCFVFPANLNLL